MTPDAPEPRVRPLVGADRAAWDALWAGYLAFYDEDVDDETTDVVFQRLVDPGWPRQWGLVAELDGRLVGLAHALVHPSTWATADDTYLEDLFVVPDARGDGVGRALLDALVDHVRETGGRRLWWLTDDDNATARRLYDRVGTLQPQVRYVAEP